METCYFMFMAVLLLMSSCCSQRAGTRDMPAVPIENDSRPVSPDEEFAPLTLIVYFVWQVGKDALLAEAKQMKCEIIYDYNVVTAVALRIPDDMDIRQAISRIEKVCGVLQVSRDGITHLNQNNGTH